MKNDVFGTSGDFTTSPEINQMFGEVSVVMFHDAPKQALAASRLKIYLPYQES